MTVQTTLSVIQSGHHLPNRLTMGQMVARLRRPVCALEHLRTQTG
jgi:hypothetical protein